MGPSLSPLGSPFHGRRYSRRPLHPRPSRIPSPICHPTYGALRVTRCSPRALRVRARICLRPCPHSRCSPPRCPWYVLYFLISFSFLITHHLLGNEHRRPVPPELSSSSISISNASGPSVTLLGPPMSRDDARIILANVSELAELLDDFVTRLETALGNSPRKRGG